MPRYAFLAASMFLVTAPIFPLKSADIHGESVGTAMPLGKLAGNPMFALPSNMRLISAFGERPAFSPDGTKIGFIGQSYGDAYEYDIATGAIRNLTAHAPHKGFLRIHYLSDGSYLLLGPRVPAASREATRNATIELFWMDASATRPPVPLGKTVWEGIAVSRTSNRIAWTEIQPLAPSITDIKSSAVMTATVVVNNGMPRLESIKKVLETGASQCLVEPQDFLPGDTGLTLPCYHIPPKADGRQTDVVALDFKTAKLVTYPTPVSLYGEVEGLFPDGKHTLVECSGDRSAGMDLCLLKLNEKNPSYTRLTRIMDYGRWKYGNPVVSPDGRTIAVQIGSADVVDAGVGQGIVLIALQTGF